MQTRWTLILKGQIVIRRCSVILTKQFLLHDNGLLDPCILVELLVAKNDDTDEEHVGHKHRDHRDDKTMSTLGERSACGTEKGTRLT